MRPACRVTQRAYLLSARGPILPRVFGHAVKERPIVVVGHRHQQHVVDPAPVELEHAIPRQGRAVGISDAIAIVSRSLPSSHQRARQRCVGRGYSFLS